MKRLAVSSRLVPLAALSIMLLVIFWAVVATAQQPGQFPAVDPNTGAPIGQQYLQPGVVPVQPPVAGQTGTVQPGAIAPLAPLQDPQFQPLPQAPFQLTADEERVLDLLLTDWQTMSAKVTTFEADFTRWDYDGVFGKPNEPKRVIRGLVKYAAPDKGLYQLEDQSEKWICTGDAVYEFKADLKQVREFPLPPEMRGKAIADGPMPFVFGIEAAKMKARYWLRISTPPASQANQVWLEVYPRHAKDSANFSKIDVILSFEHDGRAVTKLEPYALNMHLPNGKERTVYQFSGIKINNVINNVQGFLGNFVRPRTPFGWQHQVDDRSLQPAEGPRPGEAAAPGIGGVPPATIPR